MTKKNKIYLDVCCLNRPFDDQNQDRIRMEAESVIIILKNVPNRNFNIIGSEVIIFEINKTPDPVRKFNLHMIVKNFSTIVKVNNNINERAKKLQTIGFKSIDALHIACAERSKVDIFLTTDDKLLKLSKKNTSYLNINIDNPLSWLKEYLKDEYK